LRGINIHAEAPYRGGRAWSQQDAVTLLGWAHELHCNFVRLAHYPHDEHMTREADKLGIMVWSEIPTYWSIDWKGAHALESAKQQLYENIRRDHNKASVILWSVSNETPKSEERLVFLKALVDEAHQPGSHALVTSAMLTHMDGKTGILDDPLGQYLDVLGSNEYIGWYGGKPDTAPSYTWQNPYNKPLIMSEWGGGAKSGLHGEITKPLHRRDAGGDLQTATHHAEQDSVSGRHHAVAADGFSLAGAPAAEHSGLLQPQGRDLEQRHQEEGVFRACRTTTRRCRSEAHPSLRD
jgi:beta-glucuronidase